MEDRFYSIHLLMDYVEKPIRQRIYVEDNLNFLTLGSFHITTEFNSYKELHLLFYYKNECMNMDECVVISQYGVETDNETTMFEQFIFEQFQAEIFNFFYSVHECSEKYHIPVENFLFCEKKKKKVKLFHRKSK